VHSVSVLADFLNRGTAHRNQAQLKFAIGKVLLRFENDHDKSGGLSNQLALRHPSVGGGIHAAVLLTEH
jgi:hypothetical protein